MSNENLGEIIDKPKQHAGHVMLPAIFPNFTLLTIGSFIYGFIASGVYGWIVAVTFVFFYNLWPALATTVFGERVTARSSSVR